MSLQRIIGSVALLVLLSIMQLCTPAHGIDRWEPEFLVEHPETPSLKQWLSDQGVPSEDFRPDPSGKISAFLSKDLLESFLEKFPEGRVREQAQPLRKKLLADVPSGYLDLDGIWARLRELVDENPTLLAFVNLTSYGPGRTYEGREMPMVKLSDNVEKDEDEPNVLIVSSHHCREIINPHIALDMIDRFLKGYRAGDEQLRRIVDENEIFISPLWNPDGYNYVWEVNNMWRKNRKPTVTPGVYGVDQNRNYPYGWASSCSGDSLPVSETYKGPSAASEEETQIIMAFSRERVFAKVNDFHSYGREVLHSFVCEPFPAALDSYIITEAQVLASKVGTRYATRRPSGDGQHQEFHIKEETAYSFLTETQLAFQPAFSAAEMEAEYLWPMNLHFFDRVIPFTGHVFSSAGGPLKADISVGGFNDLYWKSSERFGRFHLFLPNGNYNVTITADNHRTGYLPVSISNTQAAFGEITLQAL